MKQKIISKLITNYQLSNLAFYLLGNSVMIFFNACRDQSFIKNKIFGYYTFKFKFFIQAR